MRLKVFLVITLISLVTLTACLPKDPIQIGFVGTLTGPNSEIGIAMRDGMLLKVEEVNSAGGVDGRIIELIIKDDMGDAEQIKEINRSFIDGGIQIIFGHELSSKAEPLMEVIKDQEIIVMSPTLSTFEISGLDDNFFRTIPSNFDQGTTLGTYASDLSKKTLLIYDDDNRKFAEGVNGGFISTFEGTTDLFPVAGSVVDAADQIVEAYVNGGFDSVMYVMNPKEVMYMSQVFYSRDMDVTIYSSNWGMAVNALSEGGKAIEGAVFVSFMGNLDNESFKTFREKYVNRYQKEPEFASIYSYEAATLLFKALDESRSLKYNDIKETLLGFGDQEGLVSPYRLDEYGDVQRNLFLAVVKDGELEILE